MKPEPTSTRVYKDLRRSILGRQLTPGDHLDPAALGRTLASSTTPVREALSRLVGEGLVETRQGAGFYVSELDEPGLQDLYAWTGDLAILALQADCDLGRLAHPGLNQLDYTARTSALFLQIASASSNCEHAVAMRNANARLHAVRCGEPQLLAGALDELNEMQQMMHSGLLDALRRACVAFVNRRQRIAGELVRRRYRAQ